MNFPLIRLIRPLNLIIILFTQYMVRFAFLYPVYKAVGFSLQLNEFVFFMFSMAFVFMAAGGYIINDYCDMAIDKVNKPTKVIIGNTISVSMALTAYWVLSGIGIIIGVWASYKAGLPSLGLLFFIYLSGLWFYSSNLKYVFLIGNIVIALFLALVPFTAGLIELYADLKTTLFNTTDIDFGYILSWITGISVFAFFSTLAREIVKDMEDIEGDTQAGCRTIPIVLGVPDTKRVVQFVLLLIFFLSGFLQYNQAKGGDWISFSYFLIFIQLPVLFIIRQTSRASASSDFHKVSFALKLLMVSGISYLFVFAYTIH
jgi:4-hydroxybenzoate polyprenyltransferase